MQVRPGDVLLWYGSHSIVSRLVRLIQGNKVTHCSVVSDIDAMRTGNWLRARVLETNAGMPVRNAVAAVSMHENAGTAKVKIVRHKSLTFTPTDGSDEDIGKHYGYRRILNAMINHAVGRTLGFFGRDFVYKAWLPLGNDVCSTLTSRKLHTMNPRYQFNNMAEPDDFTNPDEWEVICEDAYTYF